MLKFLKKRRGAIGRKPYFSARTTSQKAKTGKRTQPMTIITIIEGVFQPWLAVGARPSGRRIRASAAPMRIRPGIYQKTSVNLPKPSSLWNKRKTYICFLESEDARSHGMLENVLFFVVEFRKQVCLSGLILTQKKCTNDRSETCRYHNSEHTVTPAPASTVENTVDNFGRDPSVNNKRQTHHTAPKCTVAKTGYVCQDDLSEDLHIIDGLMRAIF